MRLLLSLFILFSTFFTTLCFATSSANEQSCGSETLDKGVIDLRCWDTSSDVVLSGDWYIEYQALEEDITFKGYVNVPGHWREFDKPLPFLGKGIYRLKILLSQPTEGLALQLTQAHMARKVILVDERGTQRIIFDSGNTNKPERSLIKMRMPILHLPKLGRITTLLIHVNNSESIHGGIEIAPSLGSSIELIRKDQVLKHSTIAITTILAAFFAINLYLWWVRERSFAVLSIAAMALLISLRQMAISGILYEYFPALSSSFNSAVGWGTFFFGVIIGCYYFKATFPHLIPRWLTLFLYAVSLFGVALYIFQPLYIVQSYGAYYRPVVLVAILIYAGYLISGLRESSNELRVTVFSGTIFLLGFIADIFYFQVFEYYPTISITAIGMLIFVGTQTLVISKRYWQSIQQTAKLATELKVLNANLEEKVEERTKELAQKNEQLRTMSRTDPLTGLANRRAFDTVMRKEVRRGERNKKPLVLGMMDIDYFKSVNDDYGHDAGDIILKQIATILLDGLRAHDFSARWGGEEFCILLPETEAEEAMNVAERIRLMIENYDWMIGDKKLNITASFGLAQWQPGQNASVVFKEADKALYEAKEKGRNQVISFW